MRIKLCLILAGPADSGAQGACQCATELATMAVFPCVNDIISDGRFAEDQVMVRQRAPRRSAEISVIVLTDRSFWYFGLAVDSPFSRTSSGGCSFSVFYLRPFAYLHCDVIAVINANLQPQSALFV